MGATNSVKVGEVTWSKSSTLDGRYFIHLGVRVYEVSKETYDIMHLESMRCAMVDVTHKGKILTVAITYTHEDREITLKRTINSSTPVTVPHGKDIDEYGRKLDTNYKASCGFGIFSDVDMIILNATSERIIPQEKDCFDVDVWALIGLPKTKLP